MPRVNLLPWRDELRKERQKNFAIAAAVAALVGITAVWGARMEINSRISYQQARNNILTEEIRILDTKIEEILGLERQKERLLARMEIIDTLQSSRPEIVHLFDEIVTTVPDGVYLTSIKQIGPRLEIKGMAESSTRVSAYMRHIDDSEWLTNPVLEVVETKDGDRSRNSRFTLSAQQVQKSQEKDEQEALAQGGQQ